MGEQGVPRSGDAEKGLLGARWLNDVEENQVNPDHQHDVESNAHMEDDVEKFSVVVFVTHIRC